jgi:hypothetical protein
LEDKKESMGMIRKRGKIRKVWKRGQVKDGVNKEERKTGRIMYKLRWGR